MTPAVVRVPAGDPDALARALGSGAPWAWFLAVGARPREDALDRLLAAAAPEHAPAATVLAGLVVDEHGVPRDDHLQAAPAIDADAAVRLAAQRLLPIRSASFAHLLVAGRALERHGPPDAHRFGPFAAQEWTARVLREDAGYLVGESVVVLPGPTERPERGRSLSHLRAVARMLPTGTWSRGDAARALAGALAGRP